eukprot:TRINITY_DN372_c5_g1_i1.p1 TRINITY_DN372_c5_g1~~TRINITY_DN372_c5_g1_i1.p1  ORF type:complete len:297 (+),score=97.61 TRINITY_DN372_c5_g1_i1:81-971(+)
MRGRGDGSRKALPLLAGTLVLTGAAAFIARLHRQHHARSKRSALPSTIDAMRERVQRDEGGRGIKTLAGAVRGDLQSAAEALVDGGRIVAILTGFPCLLDHDPPTETDGPLGAFAIARCCAALGKRVIVLTDDASAEVLMAAAAGCGVAGGQLSLEAFPPAAEWDDTDEERLLEVAVAADVVVAIERPGPASDGCYYTMMGRDMGDVVAPIDRLLELVSTKQKHVHTIGIGDGGNEVGMGKVRDAILASAAVPSAELITCVTPADHLIVCSVSNWGGYAPPPQQPPQQPEQQRPSS